MRIQYQPGADRGRYRIDGGPWKPVRSAPKRIVRPVGYRPPDAMRVPAGAEAHYATFGFPVLYGLLRRLEGVRGVNPYARFDLAADDFVADYDAGHRFITGEADACTPEVAARLIDTWRRTFVEPSDEAVSR